jgi:hypothetical protein
VVTDPAEVLVRVAGILDSLAIRYAVGGSVASSRFGEPRATHDVDIVVDIGPDRVAALVSALRPEFEVWEDTVVEAVARGRSFSVLHLEGLWKVDFFPVGRDRLAARQVDRATPCRMPTGVYVRFTSPEEVILRKLEWHRRSGGTLEGQLRDVRGVLKTQGAGLDLASLRAFARDLGLEEALETCLRDAGLDG